VKKDNILFGIIGLLVGLMAGFFFANSVNQNALMLSQQGAAQTGALPGNHPAIPGSNSNGGAVPEVQAAIENARANQDDFDAQLKAAELFYQIQRFDGAIEFLKKANQIKPDNYDVLVSLGNANFDSSKYEEAEKWYSSALTQRPDDLNVRTDLGLTFVFREKPNFDRAIAEFKRVLSSNADHPQALQNLTVAYTKKGDLANAKATLEKLSQVAPTNEAIPQLRSEIEKLEKK